MSRTHSKLSNKNENNLNVYSNQYLYNANEPYDSMSNNPMAENEVGLIKNCESMRQGFRNYARKIRR